MRGRSGWLSCNSYGRIGRLGQAVLKSLQYDKEHYFTAKDAQALQFHLEVISRVPPRHLSLNIQPQNPLVMYTDAEFTEHVLPGIGILIFLDPPFLPVGFCMKLPDSLVASWIPRRQQIFPAETAAIPIALAALQKWVGRRDVVVFCDNESAVSTLIRGASRAEDCAQLAELTHALLVQLSTRMCVEWVDSESNPADGLSRLGLSDPWTRAQGYSLAALPNHTLPQAREDVFAWAVEMQHWGHGFG